MATSDTVRVLSIDAWREAEGGWAWNNWYAAGEVPRAVLDYTPRRLIGYMRREGFLSAGSVGRVAVEDDGYNLVLVERGTRMPAFAIEYGAEG